MVLIISRTKHETIKTNTLTFINYEIRKDKYLFEETVLEFINFFVIYFYFYSKYVEKQEP